MKFDFTEETKEKYAKEFGHVNDMVYPSWGEVNAANARLREAIKDLPDSEESTRVAFAWAFLCEALLDWYVSIDWHG